MVPVTVYQTFPQCSTSVSMEIIRIRADTIHALPPVTRINAIYNVIWVNLGRDFSCQKPF